MSTSPVRYGNTRHAVVVLSLAFSILPSIVHSFVGVSFTIPFRHSESTISSPSIFQLFESPEGERQTPPREEANLVDQTRYLNSIETLQKELT